MLQSLEIVSAALFALIGASLVSLAVARWTRPAVALRATPRHDQAVFLFEGQDLVDASPAGRRLLWGKPPGSSDLAALLALLAHPFGRDLGARLADLPAAGSIRLAVPSGGTLEAEAADGALRLTLRMDDEDGLDRLSLDSAREELALLRGIAEDAPQPIWALDGEGQLAWANRAYLDLADRLRNDRAAPMTWPLAPLFPSAAGASGATLTRGREALELPGREEPMWFDVTTMRRGQGTLHFAADVSNLVAAEAARHHFVQALAKTFAHLATGLAIFDWERRLVLFNPAFLDLTGLPMDFLSTRPLVHSVLDRLREAKLLPEPRDYASWREQVAALEDAAAQGAYADTWTLPDGRTYRVTGRPHPDGALAFLFEDISDALGESLRLRAQLAAARQALDHADEALAVFEGGDGLGLWSAAYAHLWGAPTEGADLSAEMARWKAASPPSPLWDRLAAPDPGSVVEHTLAGPDGRPLRLRLSPLPRGATLASFAPTSAARLPPAIPVGARSGSGRPDKAAASPG